MCTGFQVAGGAQFYEHGEPRIALDAIDVVWKAGGRAGVTLSGTVMQTMQNVELTITLRE
ncbi:phage baseplate protein [Escherichia coli]|nr:phage baseplate protein [Escherichia coli]